MWFVVALAGVGVLVGCVDANGHQPPVQELTSTSSSTRVPALPSPTSTSTDEIESLRALGYLDYSEEGPSPSGDGVMTLDRTRAFPGYTLVVYAGACACDLITLSGSVVKSWSDSSCRRWEQARLLNDGSLLVVGTRSDKQQPVNQQMEGRFLLKLSWDGSVVWRRRLNVHHDLQVLDDGRLLTLLMERRLIDAVDPEAEVWDDVLAILSADGTVLERLSVYDAIVASEVGFPLQVAGRGERDGEQWIDLLHCNAAEWIEPSSLPKSLPVSGSGIVLVTSRHQDSVMIIDWAKKQLIWHWGRGELSGPHAATMQPNGKLLIFDNGLERRWSRVIELDPTEKVICQTYSTPDKSQFFSRVMGGCQRLPNGNVLIANSAGGQGLELTAEGQPVWIFLGTRRTEKDNRVKIPRLERIRTEVIDRIIGEHG